LREKFLKHLACPTCHSDLGIKSVAQRRGDILETAQLACQGCPAVYPVLNCIPRFVSNDNYASGFGLEWTRHARTQYDSYTGVKLSETRFFGETHWPRNMPGEIILEVGSG